MFPNNYSILLLTIILAICHISSTSYLSHEIKSEFCFGPNYNSRIEVLNDSAIDTSIILEFSQLMAKTCAVRINMSPKIDGLILKAENVSIESSTDCRNFIQFSSSPVTKWCQSMDAKTLLFPNTSIDMTFNFETTNQSYFKFIITPYKKPISGQKCMSSAPIKCDRTSSDDLCISNDFSCDGIDNCPEADDELGCVQTKIPEIIEHLAEINSENNKTVKDMNYGTTEPSNDLSEDSNYHRYNVFDYCNKSFGAEIALESGTDPTISPAILYLSLNDSKKLNETNCVLRFTSQTSNVGLSVGIDSLSIQSKNNNNSCSDFIQISGSDSSQTIWCDNKTDNSGIAFNGNYIDFVFHAGNQSNSAFELIISEFKKPMKVWVFGEICPDFSELKCNSGDRKQCISKKFKCDGHRNCPNGDDENGCSVTPPPTTPPTTPTPSTSTTTTPPTTTPTTTTTNGTTTVTPSPSTPTPSPSTPTPSPSTPAPTPSTPSPTPSHSTPAPTPSPSTPAPAPTPKPGPSSGIIALIVIGSLVGASAVVAFVYICLKKRRGNTGYSALNE